jgi:DtxR family Mn-dependent transcriptional regulator
MFELIALIGLAEMGNASLSPIIVILITTTAIFFYPNKGLLAQWRQSRINAEKIRCEDTLKFLYNEEISGQKPNKNNVAGALQVSVQKTTNILSDMEKRGLIVNNEGNLRLTTEGKRYALHIIRAHRLWERYLSEETGYTEKEWHNRAEHLEHQMTPEQVDALDIKLNHPSYDPHGDPIPTASGEMTAEIGVSLNTLPVDGLAQILHLEDEPASIYAQLIAQGLRPGMELRVLEKTAGHIRIWAGGDEHVLASLVANSVTIQPIHELQMVQATMKRSLAHLAVGQKAQVLRLDSACRGAERRRLLDLGFVPGAMVEAVMKSPAGDPTAYRVRGTLIALRREQADTILTAPANEELAA